MAKTMARSVDLEPIDRLEEKVKRLVAMVEQMRADQARSGEENARLLRELEQAKSRLAAADSAGAELVALRDERDVIKQRVTQMLGQLDALNL